jgi:RNA polymerase sigma-70 factor (ECF subfamily)
MSENLEHSFVKTAKDNQNIIHRSVGCILIVKMHTRFIQEITIQLWKAFPKFRGDSKFSTWPIV